MSRVQLPHINLNTQVDGPADAPWIILSNSLGATHAMWDPQMPFLTTKFRVLRYDTRGHGGSDAPEGPYDFDLLTSDVIALMDHFDIQKSQFMGLSMGGMTGLGLALNHPDRFERIVCADARADAPAPFLAMWDDRISKVRQGGLKAIVDGTLASWLTADWHKANPTALKDIADMILSNDPDGYISCCLAIKGLDYLQHLGGVGLPVLYVGGANDMGAAPDVMREMAKATPGGEFVEIANAAHVANINAPDAFNEAIRSFLEV